MNPPKVLIITNIPSYHQVDLFDEIARRSDLLIEVFYLRRITPGRHWKHLPSPQHPHRFLYAINSTSAFFVNPTILYDMLTTQYDLLVVCQYSGLSYQIAMYLASIQRKPWVFWSERLGVESFEVRNPVPEILRPAVRSIAFYPAKKFARDLWAIGNRAVSQYQSLTGRTCSQFDYYSDIERYRRGNAGYLKNNQVRFLFAGRFSFRKGFDLLMQACIELVQRGISVESWQITLCGTGPMKSMIEKTRASGPIAMYDIGFIELDEMPGVFTQHDVLICPSRYDGWGMVVPEALAAGLFVIASNEVGSALDVGDCSFLRLFPSGDVHDLADRMEWCIHNRYILRELGLEAAAAARNYDVTRGSERFQELVTRALQAGNSGNTQ